MTRAGDRSPVPGRSSPEHFHHAGPRSRNTRSHRTAFNASTRGCVRDGVGLLHPADELRVDLRRVLELELDMMAIRRDLLALVDSRILERRVEHEIEDDPGGARVNAGKRAPMAQVEGGLLFLDLERAQLADFSDHFRVGRLTGR